MHQCCSKEENELTQTAVGWIKCEEENDFTQNAIAWRKSKEKIKFTQKVVRRKKSSVLQFPRAIVLGPEQIKAIKSERRVILLMGEAGTGKTTVLLATLFKYTGKHVPAQNRKKVVFSIPYHKMTFKNDILSFIKQFCFREWVEILLGFNEGRVCRNTGSTVYLFDEIYDTDFLSRILARGKIYAVVIPGEKITTELKRFHCFRSDLELIYFRKTYRTPAEISRCCVKLKRLLDEEKYKKKNQVKAHSLGYNSTYQDIPCYNSTYQDIPWEMSFSNSTPLREGNAIEIRPYQSLQMEDLKKSIGQSDLIVTLNLEKEKIEEMDLVFDTNTVFHENSDANNHNELAAVGRSSGGGKEIIVLICGKNFTKESLISQQGLLRYIELKQCVVYVICDHRVSQEVNHFSFDFGSQYIYEEPFGFELEGARFWLSFIEECIKMRDKFCRSKLREIQTQVITLCQTIEAISLINSIFQESAVVHMNIEREKIGWKNSDRRGGEERNAKSHPKAVKKEIVLIFGHPSWEQLPLERFCPCFFNLVEEGFSLTLISQDISLNDISRISSLAEDSKKNSSKGFEDLLQKCSEKLLGDLEEIVDGRLIQFANRDCALIIRENLRNIIEQDFAGILKSIEILIGENFTERSNKYLIEIIKRYYLFDERQFSFSNRYLLQMFGRKSDKISKFYENLNIKSVFQKIRLVDKSVRRFFLENWDNFHKNTLVTLVEEQKIWQLSDMDYIMIPWVHRNVHNFREVFWNLLGFESQGTSTDEKLIKREIFRIGERNLRNLVRRNLNNFEKSILRSLVVEDFFSFEHLSFRTLEKVDFGNLRTLINQHLSTIFDDINMKAWVRINFVDQGLKTFIINDLMECDDELLTNRVSKVLRNLELLRILTEKDERRKFSSEIFNEALRAGLIDEKVNLIINESAKLICYTMATLSGVDFMRNVKPIKHLWESATQLNIVRLSPDSLQFDNLLPIFNYSEGNRLIVTFGINEKVSGLLNRFLCNDTVIHRSEYDNPYCCLFDHVNEEHSCSWSEKVNYACDNDSYKKRVIYDYIIFLIPRKMNSHSTLLELQMIKPHLDSCDCSAFFCVSDNEVYENLITEEFHFNGRPFFEILKYSDSSSNEEIIELIPLFKQKTILLAWNVEEEISQKISEFFVQYEIKRIPRTQEEPFRKLIENREINFLILVCGELEGKTYLPETVLDEITHLRIKCSIYIVCHSITSDHIKSVFLSCSKYNFLERKILPDILQESIDIGSTIPSIEADIETEVLILTWNISQDILRYLEDTFQNCTIWRVDQQSISLARAYDEVILVCCAPLSISAIASGLSRFSGFFRSKCNFYLVSDQNYYAKISSVLPTGRAFHFSSNFCFFGDSIIHQIDKVPVLKSVPKVLLVTLNLDKPTALEIDKKFTSYTSKHVDLMPWSSDNLSFTGSEFDSVVVICNEHTNAQSRETKSVLYSALTRAKQKVTVFCHENSESNIQNILSLSSVDQIFHKIPFDNVGEKLLSELENQYNVLEAFKRIIVSKNVAQFNSLEKFVSDCPDPSFDWVFQCVQSMLLGCFPWGHEIVHMLNKFLAWRPAFKSEVNIFNSSSFFCEIEVTKEQKEKLLEGKELGLRSTNLAFDTLSTTTLKNLAYSAVDWNQMILFDEIFQRLKIKLSLDDDFFAELLHHAIVLNEIEYVERVVETIANRESRIFCLLKRTAPFIDEEMFCNLVKSVRMPSDLFLMQNVSEEPFQTLIHYFASTATTQCFTKVLDFLPKQKVKFSAFNLQDDLGRNVLMSAVCNSETFRLILDRAKQQGDLDVLLSQKDSRGWSCLRHACHADNIDVVKLLVRDYSFNYINDVDSREVQLMDFVQFAGRNYIKNSCFDNKQSHENFAKFQ